jgi:alanyl-tRNA synthetase
MKTAEIKRRYLAHFEANGHTVVPSAPLPAIDDPNLLFINAGMVQFVPYFLGQRTPPFARAVSVQKCIRTPDIDEVGKTSRHGTFFQMNGNFSFGDYFKEGAVELAWELSTKSVAEGGFGLDAERIWPTVYLDDDEAFELWRGIGVPVEHIVRRGKKDNYWSMGIPGPAGPCSELFYDRGPEYGKDGGPEVDEDRFMEYWNLVFMTYEITDVKSKEDFTIVGDLPAKNIDTGMGLERIASILQGVDNLYEIDEVRPILARAAEMTGKQYGVRSGHVAGESHPDDVRLRVIADHVRTALMLIGDGVTPSNEGRGYVLRRIMRRAMRHAQLLGAKEPLMWRLVPALVREMGQAYPELVRAEPLVTETLKLEETRFRRTLERGLAILDEESRDLGAGQNLSGDVAFTLYDTYGFPLDLTQDALKARGVGVDTGAFNAAMERQREKARAAWAGSGEAATEAVWYAIRERAGATEFLGYDTETAEGVVLAIVKDGQETEELKAGDSGLVVLNQTPFYGESGGQIGDTGAMTALDARARVEARKNIWATSSSTALRSMKAR